MIEPTKKRLTVIFTLIVLGFSVVILSISYAFLHKSIVDGVKRHMVEDIRTEFLDQFTRSGLDPFKNMWDEHHFQILNRNGDIIVASRNSEKFYPWINRTLLTKAFSGRQEFETCEVAGDLNLVSYFPLDGNYVGRISASLGEEMKYQRSFVRLAVIFFPLMVVLSYLVSRYLVNQAMRPISDVFMFQETFSSNVTHELRSPLTSIKGNFEVSLRKDRSAEEYRDVIDFGLRETDRIINLLNNLSLLASSKFKPLDLFKNKADINLIVKEVVASYLPLTDARGLTLTVSESPGLSCLCDEGLIRRTVENLVDNAVKYTPGGGKIGIVLSQSGRKVFLRISNTCSPIGKEEIQRIFEPFYRCSKPVKLRTEGKGLGLYIARYIVRSHGGDLTLDNAEQGVFSLTLSLPAGQQK